MKISDLAKEMGCDSKELLAFFQEQGRDYKGVGKGLTDEDIALAKAKFVSGGKENKKEKEVKKVSLAKEESEDAKEEKKPVKEEKKAEEKETKTAPAKPAEGIKPEVKKPAEAAKAPVNPANPGAVKPKKKVIFVAGSAFPSQQKPGVPQRKPAVNQGNAPTGRPGVQTT